MNPGLNTTPLQVQLKEIRDQIFNTMQVKTADMLGKLLMSSQSLLINFIKKLVIVLMKGHKRYVQAVKIVCIQVTTLSFVYQIIELI